MDTVAPKYSIGTVLSQFQNKQDVVLGYYRKAELPEKSEKAKFLNMVFIILLIYLLSRLIDLFNPNYTVCNLKYGHISGNLLRKTPKCVVKRGLFE